MKKIFSLLTIALFVLSCNHKKSKNIKPLNIEIFATYTYPEISNQWHAAYDWADQHTGKTSKKIDLRSLLEPYGDLYVSVKKENFRDVKHILSLRAVRNLFPEDLRFMWSAQTTIDKNNNEIYRLYTIKVPEGGKAPLNSSHIENALRGYDTQANINTVNLDMTEEGQRVWMQMTTENLGRTLAVTANNKVFTSPSVTSIITSGSTQISGDFTEEEAQELADRISAGHNHKF